MNKKLLFSLLIPSLILCGCNKKNEEPEGEPTQEVEDLTPDQTVEYEIYDTFKIAKDKSCYKVRTNYTDKYFKYKASTYKQDLMKLSFASAMSAQSVELGHKFFEDIGFSNVYTSESYEVEPTEHSVHYIVYKKAIDDFTLYAVAVKGTNYLAEWTDNLTLGESGNHVGFNQSANTIYEKLCELINAQGNVKLWLSGYSRGAAICNVLSSKIMKNSAFSLQKDTLYTYTFATPRGLIKEDAIAYENVFNMVNYADIVTSFAPEAYGLYRCGKDIDIYNDNIETYLSEFSSELTMSEFTIVRNVYLDDVEYTAYLLESLLDEEESEPEEGVKPNNLSTRSNYYAVQDDICYIVGRAFKISNVEKSIIDDFNKLSLQEKIALLNDPAALCEKAKDIFDANEITYEEDKLLEACTTLSKIIVHYLSLVYSVTANNNAVRMIDMHMTETVYAAITHFEYK